MTQITFEKNDNGWYEATVAGFTGVLQVDRAKAGLITIYGKTVGCKEVALFSEFSDTTLQSIDMATCISLRIECGTEVSKAQYEAE